jgi:hypothetical protein
MDNNQPQEPQSLNFEGDNYNVSDLTPRAAQEFNTLFRIQNEINELAYQLKKSQAAQAKITEDVKVILKEDKVKPIEDDKEIIVEDEVKAEDDASVN